MSRSGAPNGPVTNQGLGAGHIMAIVLGVIFALAGIGSLLGGGVLGWAHATQRDSGGYFSTSTDRFVTSTYAITSDRLDLNSGAGPSDWFVKNDNIATVRIRAKTNSNVFVGIARQADVDRYFAGVAHDEVTKVNYRPFSAAYRLSPGTIAPTSPANETFWVAKASGEGTQTLTWNPTSGAWAVVVMNSDATPAVSADVALALRVSFLGWLVSALGLAGVVSLLVGAALIIAGAHRSQRATSSAALAAPSASRSQGPAELSVHEAHRSTPVRLEGHLAEPLSRWLWLVKWILLIPHLIVLAFLWIGFVVVTVVAGIAIVFTGRYPRSLFEFNVGVLRWTWRVQFYGPNAYGTDAYPPFSLERSTYPATLDIDYPEHLSRWMVFVKSWLLAIPHLIIVGIFSAGWSLWNGNRFGFSATQYGFPGGLIGTCAIVAGILLLIRRSYPVGLFDFIIGMNRWVYRVVAYVALMTDDYPPFHFDGGPTEPRGPQPELPRPDPSERAAAPDGHRPVPVGT